MCKKIISIIGISVCLILGSIFGADKAQGINKYNDRIYTQASMIYNGFNETLETSDVVIVGQVEEIKEYPQYDEYTVQVIDVNKGDVGKSIIIRNYLYDYSYECNGEEYTGKTKTGYSEGEQYVFVLQHIWNVYEEKYVILSDTYIPLENIKNSTVLSQNISNGLNPLEYIANYSFKSSGKGSELSIDYIESDDIKEIIDYSDYVSEVEVLELYLENDVSDVYLCRVKNNLKGSINTSDDGTVIIPFFKNSVETGKVYTVCLMSDSKDSLIYTLSSKNSIMECSDTDSIMILIEEESLKNNAP